MTDKETQLKILEGCHFILKKGSGDYFYKSYVYRQKTYVKYLRDNGTDLSLGQYSNDGMSFVKRFRTVSRNPRNAHIFVLDNYISYLHGIKNVMTINPQTSIEYISPRDIDEERERSIDARDDQDYFYRIGLR